MNISISQSFLNQGETALRYLSRIPEQYHALSIERKDIIKIIAATTGIFLTIGVLFGFIPFMCTSLGYLTPHIVTIAFPLSSETDLNYLIGMVICYTFFGLTSFLTYIAGSIIYKLEPIALSDLYLLFDRTEPEISALVKDMLAQDTAWLYQNREPIPLEEQLRIIRLLGGNITQQQIANLWNAAEQNVSRIQFNYVLKRQDYRTHHFLLLLSEERREEFITRFNWPRETPDRNLSARGFFNEAYRYIRS